MNSMRTYSNVEKQDFLEIRLEIFYRPFYILLVGKLKMYYKSQCILFRSKMESSERQKDQNH